MSKTVDELAASLQGKVIGNGKTLIKAITGSESPAVDCITFVQNEKGLRGLEKSPIACILVPEPLTSSIKPLIQVKNPKLAWARLLGDFYPAPVYARGVSPQAVIAKSAKIGKNTAIEPFAVVGEHAEIGDEAVLRSHSFVGEKVRIGAKSVLHPGVVVYENCIVGSFVTIHAGSVVGADGFGYVASEKGLEKIPQVGNVVIEDEVEIGACVTIDRATVGSTKIGRGTKIDNLVQIAHNVTIGPCTAISAQTGISGSSKIGAHVTMGGKVGLGDHVEIGDGVTVGAGAGFPSGKKVPAGQIVFGQPARPYAVARKQIAAQLRAAEMLEEIKKLRGRVAELEKKLERSAGLPAD